jgi:hypothetical protein
MIDAALLHDGYCAVARRLVPCNYLLTRHNICRGHVFTVRSLPLATIALWFARCLLRRSLCGSLAFSCDDHSVVRSLSLATITVWFARCLLRRSLCGSLAVSCDDHCVVRSLPLATITLWFARCLLRRSLCGSLAVCCDDHSVVRSLSVATIALWFVSSSCPPLLTAAPWNVQPIGVGVAS